MSLSKSETIVVTTHLYEPALKIKEITADRPGTIIRFYHVELSQVAEISAAKRTEIFKDATILITSRLFPSSAAECPNLRLIHVTSAGLDQYSGNEYLQHCGIPITTSTGVASVPIAEWVLMCTLTASRHYNKLLARHLEQEWDRSDFVPAIVSDWAGQTIGIAGYGSIRRQVARIFDALGTRVHAYTARPRPAKQSRRADGFALPRTGDPEGIIPARWYSGTERHQLHEFLSSGLDLLVICLPLKADTQSLFSASEFETLANASVAAQRERSCFLVNVSRGSVIDQSALIRALELGQISGAALDVADPEPLPQSNPLWKAPNCFITPHISWSGTQYLSRCLDLLVFNLDRVAEGQNMVNLVQF